MQKIFRFINENAIVASIITLFLNALLNFIITNYFKKKDISERKKEIIRQENQKHFENKPELYVVENDEKLSVSISVFLGMFKVKYNDNKNFKIIYSKSIKNRNKHNFKDIVLENIGKSDIECLDLCLNDKKGIMLTDYNDLAELVDNGLICCNYCYDRKIRAGEKIKIRIYFEKDIQPVLLFASTLLLLFEDSNHQWWEQPFFYEKDNVYSPYKISYETYRTNISLENFYNNLNMK